MARYTACPEPVERVQLGDVVVDIELARHVVQFIVATEACQVHGRLVERRENDRIDEPADPEVERGIQGAQHATPRGLVNRGHADIVPGESFSRVPGISIERCPVVLSGIATLQRECRPCLLLAQFEDALIADQQDLGVFTNVAASEQFGDQFRTDAAGVSRDKRNSRFHCFIYLCSAARALNARPMLATVASRSRIGSPAVSSWIRMRSRRASAASSASDLRSHSGDASASR